MADSYINLGECNFFVVEENLLVSTTQRIDNNTFILVENGDLYFNNTPPWEGPYYELVLGDYVRVEDNYV